MRINNTNQIAKKSVYETVTQVVEESNLKFSKEPFDASEIVETPWDEYIEKR